MRSAVFLVLSLVSMPVMSEDDDLLTRTLNSLDRALIFIGERYFELNVDGILGARIVADQLQVLITRFSDKLQKCEALHPLFKQLDNLLRMSTSVVEQATKTVAVWQREYYETIGGMLNHGLWGEDFPDTFLKPSSPSSEGGSGAMFDEGISDRCCAELLGSNSYSATRCNISDSCWKYMTGTGLKEYYITHEILYLEVGQQLGCGKQMDERALKTYGKTVRKIQNDYCYQIFLEGKGFEADGYPVMWQDLLMEQIALCGILGFRDFFQPQWVEKILSVQKSSGCFALYDHETDNLISRRKKREDHAMKGGCSAHKTAVAIGALMVSARFMIADLISNPASCVRPVKLNYFPQ